MGLVIGVLPFVAFCRNALFSKRRNGTQDQADRVVVASCEAAIGF